MEGLELEEEDSRQLGQNWDFGAQVWGWSLASALMFGLDALALGVEYQHPAVPRRIAGSCTLYSVLCLAIFKLHPSNIDPRNQQNVHTPHACAVIVVA